MWGVLLAERLLRINGGRALGNQQKLSGAGDGMHDTQPEQRAGIDHGNADWTMHFNPDYTFGGSLERSQLAGGCFSAALGTPRRSDLCREQQSIAAFCALDLHQPPRGQVVTGGSPRASGTIAAKAFALLLRRCLTQINAVGSATVT